MMLARARDHANELPEHFGQRIRLLAEVLDGETALALGVRRGDQAALECFMRRHGDWKQAIETFEAAGPHLAYVASWLQQTATALQEIWRSGLAQSLTRVPARSRSAILISQRTAMTRAAECWRRRNT